jgi:hypothetical protein
MKHSSFIVFAALALAAASFLGAVAYTASLEAALAGDGSSPLVLQHTYRSTDFALDSDVPFTETVDFVDEGSLLLLTGPDPARSIQIFSHDYNGSPQLTPDILREAVPGLILNAPRATRVGGERALAFYSHQEDFGDTFEVWFTRWNLLYQVTVRPDQSDWLLALLSTWRFLF